MDYAELELGLYPRDAESYSVELRFTPAGSEADVRPPERAPEVHFDFDALRALQLDPAAYGQRLSESLFIDPVWQAFDKAQASAQAAEAALRVRLTIDSHAPELHRLYWETLRAPTGEPLFTGETVLFSRYLSSLDWRPVRLRPKGQVRTLVVIANPSDLNQFQLTPVDVSGELGRARAALGDIPITALAVTGESPDRPDTRPTLDNMMAHLRDGYDLVYLACHGTLVKSEPWLWLEDDDGHAARVKGSEWVARLRELLTPPRLIVLASCQSAAEGQGGTLSALGPRLAEAGIPAVIAMQGDITTLTVEKFMLTFFSELKKDGQIDRALAVARGAVRDRPDSWMPSLFMRLKSGRLWYAAGFADDPRGLKKWPALISNIRERQCTPVLGPGLLDVIFGPRRELAWRWALEYRYPLAPHERENLTFVAQYLAVEQDAMYPRTQLAAFVRERLLTLYSPVLGEAALAELPLPDLISAVDQHLREANPNEPHRVLASLNLPLYITANPDNLLMEALIAQGKHPRAQVCKWNSATRKLPSPADDDPTYQPTPAEPLIFYLFGSLQFPNSMVLTEDDYDNYLIEVNRNPKSIPGVVRDRLAATALLFVGFSLSERSFRVLLRTIFNQEGSKQLEDYAHITAQMDPEEAYTLEPRRARAYIESYFQKVSTSLFWGSVPDFATQLGQHWRGGG